MGNKKTRLGLIGSKGRMGQAIRAVIDQEFSEQLQVAVTVDKENSGQFAKLAEEADVFIDVSMPGASEKFLQELVRHNARIPYVIGCTGWTESQLKAVHAYAERACVVLAPNFSPGVNLFLSLIEQAAPVLAKWGYDVSVHETHHTRKLDSPSGTAKAIVERLGNMKPQVHATRAGNIVGTHEVRFIGPNDIISLGHEALDRSIFARGAVMAADWAYRQPGSGLHSMKEVILSKA